MLEILAIFGLRKTQNLSLDVAEGLRILQRVHFRREHFQRQPFYRRRFSRPVLRRAEFTTGYTIYVVNLRIWESSHYLGSVSHLMSSSILDVSYSYLSHVFKLKCLQLTFQIDELTR